MEVLKIILIVIVVIVVIIFAIILLLLFIPFEYLLNVNYIEDSKVDVNLSYIIFKIKGFLILSPKTSYELKLWNKILISSEKKDDVEEKNNSIEDTGFIENEDLSKSVEESKSVIKDLFVSANRLEKKKKEENDALLKEKKEENSIQLEEKKEKAFGIIDKFKNIFKRDEIYVAKKIVSEAISAIGILKPDNMNVDIKYGSKEPYAMGLLFSIVAPLYSFFGEKLKLKQNSNSNLTEGHIDIIGHPQLYKLVASIFRLLSDKKVRTILFKNKHK